jgi:hypothetical protein
MGRHDGLLRDVTVTLASPGVKARVVPPQAHAFLPRFSPEFWIDVLPRANNNPEGWGPGRMVVASATLGIGKSMTDVVNALHEGLSPPTAASGFRIGVIVLNLLGGPPPGVATIMDDGGFMVTKTSVACR